jgi:hypothetical protein
MAAGLLRRAERTQKSNLDIDIANGMSLRMFRRYRVAGHQ